VDRIVATGLDQQSQVELYLVLGFVISNRVPNRPDLVELSKGRMGRLLGRQLNQRTFDRLIAMVTGAGPDRQGQVLKDPLLVKVRQGNKQQATLFQVVWPLPAPSAQDRFCCVKAGLEYLLGKSSEGPHPKGVQSTR